MSTVILQKDYEGKKAGETISVPFGKGRDMLKAGVAVYAPPSVPAAPKIAPVGKTEIELLAEKHSAELKSIRSAYQAEIDKLRADARISNDEAKTAMELADKATAENADLKKQIEDAKKPKGAK